MTDRSHDIIIAFFFKHKLQQACKTFESQALDEKTF